MYRVLLAASVFSLLASTGEAAMNGQTILGTTLDPRVSECGVRIEGETMAVIRPFIEASSELTGHVQIDLKKRSRSGTSSISQGGSFEHGSLGNVSLSVDRPARIGLAMAVRDDEGRLICEIDEEFELALAS